MRRLIRFVGATRPERLEAAGPPAPGDVAPASKSQPDPPLDAAPDTSERLSGQAAGAQTLEPA
jgi:hypothetical protein